MFDSRGPNYQNYDTSSLTFTVAATYEEGKVPRSPITWKRNDTVHVATPHATRNSLSKSETSKFKRRLSLPSAP